MENLFIQSDTTTPEIDFKGISGEFKFTGRSFPENVFDFYNPVLDYINLYAKQTAPETVVIFNMSYFNTASYKMIVKILLAFSTIDKNNSPVNIKWCCDVNDLTIVEKGEELKEYLKLNLEIVQAV